MEHKPNKVEYLSLLTENVYDLRLIGEPFFFFKGLISTEKGNRFCILHPTTAEFLGVATHKRAAMTVFDRSDSRVKVIDTPIGVVRQMSRIIKEVQKYRRKHSRKGEFHAGGIPFGLELRLVVEGKQIHRRVHVTGWPKMLTSHDRKLLKTIEIPNLNKLYGNKIAIDC